jgi:hypothetical protein
VRAPEASFWGPLGQTTTLGLGNSVPQVSFRFHNVMKGPESPRGALLGSPRADHYIGIREFRSARQFPVPQCNEGPREPPEASFWGPLGHATTLGLGKFGPHFRFRVPNVLKGPESPHGALSGSPRANNYIGITG